jgi:hypothetical protein
LVAVPYEDRCRDAFTVVFASDWQEAGVPGTTVARLVDEFLAAMYRGGFAVDRQSVELEVRERIAEIAERLQVDPQTVLRDHASDGWGRSMSAGVLDQIHGRRFPGAVPTVSTAAAPVVGTRGSRPRGLPEPGGIPLSGG